MEKLKLYKELSLEIDDKESSIRALSIENESLRDELQRLRDSKKDQAL
jgi:hypothetical protein